ncbi:hypothetical protein JNUCC76_06135 [Leuconostoc sp. JNUCC 76]
MLVTQGQAKDSVDNVQDTVKSSVWHISTLLIIGSILFAYGVTMSLPLVVSNIGKFSNKNDISVTIVL